MSVLLRVWDCVGVSSSKCCRLLSKAKDERSNQHICKVLNEFQKLPLFLKGLLKNGTKSAARFQCNPRLGFSSMHPQPYRDPVSLFPQGRTKWLRCSQPRQLNPNEAALPGPSFLSRSGKANQTSQPSRIADILTYAFRNSESKMTLYLYVSTLMSFYLVYLLVYDNVSCLRGDYTI